MTENRLAIWLKLVRVALPLTRKLALARTLPGLQAEDAANREDSDFPAQALTDEERALFDSGKLSAIVQTDLACLRDQGIRPVSLCCAQYPPLLGQIARPPVMLFVRGDPGVLSEPQLAVVGSRNASHQGVETARDFAARLAESGFVVTSGLALGVDGAAHRGRR